MTPQSDEDLELSVYADWLEDEGRSLESQWVRESLTESPRKWERQYKWHSIGVGGGGGGGIGVGGIGVGSGVGVGDIGVGGIGGVGVGGGVGGGVGVGSGGGY